MPKILKTVRIHSRLYQPDSETDAKELAKKLNADQIARLTAAKAISGKWTPVADEDSDLKLSDLPMWLKLKSAGFDSLDKVQEATDEQLLDVDGIGEATLKQIRAALEE